MWRRLLACFLFVLGFLSLTFFKHYRGELIPYPFLFWLIGLALFAAGFLFLRYAPDPKERETHKELAMIISDLKANGEKIMVELSTCEIKEHNFSEEKQHYGRDNEFLTLSVEKEIQGWNTMGGGAWRNVEQVQVRQSVLIFERKDPRSGLVEKFETRVIPKDRITLSFYLDKQKHTTLYVDKGNRRRYYFDLDF
ncbi:MAG TPA: hypothetical protein VGM31_08885, partial [Puia sp.]